MMKALLEVGCLLIALSPCASGQKAFRPPEVSRAGDSYAQYYEPITDGLFVFDVGITDNGTIEQIHAVRNPGALLKTAEKSIRSWQFTPALEDGKPTAARMTVAFVYRPPDHGGASAVPPANFGPAIPSSRPRDNRNIDYVPVGILSFDYPERPVNNVAWGSVVAQVSISGAGIITRVEFLHGMSGFDGLVRNALTKWRFRPARLDGVPISAKAVIVFVFETATPNYP